MISEKDSDKMVVLGSMGRSGSTLLANVINSDNVYRILFEPFFPEKVEEARDFIYPLYIRPDSLDARLLAAARKILSGQIASSWIDRDGGTNFQDRLLIKDIRINLFLRWLYNNFPGLKIILLMRHPCAVVQSWLDSGFGDGTVARERLVSQPFFLEDYGPYVRDEYINAGDAFDRLVFFWCVYYRVPLQQFGEGKIHIVFYENLFLDTQSELSLLFSFLEERYSETAVLDVLATPSSTTRGDSDILQGGDKVNGWRKKVSDDRTKRVVDIMNFFDMGDLYCPTTSKPNRDAALRLLGRY